MKISSTKSSHYILKHKEYFDEKLIMILQELNEDTLKLSADKHVLQKNIDELKASNHSYRLQIDNLKSLNYSLSQKNRDLEKEKDDLDRRLRQMETKIEKLIRIEEQQEKEINKQKDKIEHYEKMIKKIRHMNSTNSNFPSSMDVLSHERPKTIASEHKSKSHKRGGQKGHPVHTSTLAKKADKVIHRRVKKAPTGAVPIRDEHGQIQYYATQEVDLSFKKFIIETRYYIDEDGAETDPVIMSRYAINPLTYSDSFKAVVVYLNQRGTIPLQRLSEMMNEISGGEIDLRPGTIVKWCQQIHEGSMEQREKILQDILSGEVIHVDETGFKVSKKNNWIHTITNEKGAYFVITQKRSDEEKGPLHLLKNYHGIAVHDHLKSYFKLMLCEHAECNAHIDRYLQSGIDFEHSKECEEMLDLLHRILHEKKELMKQGIKQMTEERIQSYEDEYIAILENGLKDYEKRHPKIESRYEAEYIKVFRRMLEYKEEHLRFMKNFKVPYTNNAAEKQCRSVKGHKNVSKQFVTEQGGEVYVGILTLLQTARLKNESALETLMKAFR